MIGDGPGTCLNCGWREDSVRPHANCVSSVTRSRIWHRQEPDRKRGMSLFQRGRFQLHSGDVAYWKIDCDALTDGDIDTLASLAFDVLPSFGLVEGVPNGGLRLAASLQAYSRKGVDKLLIVDDVLTTGASMEEQRAGRDAIGLVIFARGPAPGWVTPLFTWAGRNPIGDADA